ncbi:hypothetical protein BJ508DRAFT_28905 [Ascobolus immersus RN42]|uniref:Uncharacterized protein n=1 Tax=Ascobolus immersus RN42 TaxID=1160509 RepID=A0A3N4HPG9_ASCIM|nr:hypothetical protein BJ508DRAFT_28905 [Ascobolus immersus RN42]
MRSNDSNTPRSSNRPNFRLGPLPSPSFSQAPTPTSMPMNYTPTSGLPSQSYAVTQQQLQFQQQQILQQATRGLIPPHMLQSGPISPRLNPMGSPGPVTPLALEEGQSSYLTAKRGYEIQQYEVPTQTPSGKQ